MGRYFGIAAVDLVVKQNYGKVVCLQSGRITCCSLEHICGRRSLVDVDTLYDAERYNGRRTILNGEKNHAQCK
jgi:6-phosphofructokinase 1